MKTEGMSYDEEQALKHIAPLGEEVSLFSFREVLIERLWRFVSSIVEVDTLGDKMWAFQNILLPHRT